MIYSHNPIINTIEIIVYAYLIYLLCQIIIHHKYNTSINQYEKHKTIIYNNLKSNKLSVPFKRTFLSKTEILEFLMYSPIKYQNIITGKPNDKYNIQNNFNNICNNLNSNNI
jgi:hypothetical protein